MKIFMGLLFSLLSLSAWAGQGPLTLGGIFGDPTGLSGKLDLGANDAFDGALSWSAGSRSGTQLHVDYLKFRPQSVEAGDTYLDFYYGIGARLISLNSGDDKGKIAFGPRAPIGLKHELRDPSVEFFGEVAVILNLTPASSADIDLGVGVRYRF
jgi:hypothetical protein